MRMKITTEDIQAKISDKAEEDFIEFYNVDFQTACKLLKCKFTSKGRNSIYTRIKKNGFQADVLTEKEINILKQSLTKRKHNQAWIDAGYEFNQYNKY